MLVMLLGTIKKPKPQQFDPTAEDENPITVEMQLNQPLSKEEKIEDPQN